MLNLTFLLVHGAWHGAWCWDPLVEALDRRGSAAVSITLPGHGPEDRPGWDISLGRYAAAVNEAAAKLDGEVHVVGHSMGGAIISAAAEAEPNHYSSLIYVAAFLLRSGERIIGEARKHGNNDMSEAATIDLLRGRSSLKYEHIEKYLYNTCSSDDIKIAATHLVAQSLRPLLGKVRHSPDRWGRLPRHYIHCTQDNAIPLSHQELMVDRLPCTSVAYLDCDHSPFLSQPDILADSLISTKSVARGSR